MTYTERAFRLAEQPGGSFVIAATSEQFNDSIAALHDALAGEFGKENTSLTEGAHVGLQLANVVVAENREPHYKLDERLKLSRPRAVNAMGQVVRQADLDIGFDKPKVVGNTIVIQSPSMASINAMRRLFNSIARVPEDIKQPTSCVIEPITLSPLLSKGDPSQVARFMEERLHLQPIESPFSSLQLWETDINPIIPAEIVETVPLVRQ